MLSGKKLICRGLHCRVIILHIEMLQVRNGEGDRGGVTIKGELCGDGIILCPDYGYGDKVTWNYTYILYQCHFLVLIWF